VRVKSRLQLASRVRSAPPLSDAALTSPRVPAPTPRSKALPASSDRRVRAPRRCHGPKPCATAVQNPRRHRPAALRLRQSPPSSPMSSATPPSSASVRPLPCPLPLRRSAGQGQAGPGRGPRRIRPIGLRFALLFPVYIQINANSKFCTRFI
jgi:hypothetical protein